MNYKVFCKKRPNYSKLLDLFIVLLLIISLLLLIIISIDSCKPVIICAFALYLLKFTIERRNVVFSSKEANRLFMEKPIAFDKDNNMFIFQGKAKILLAIVAIFPFLIIFITKFNDSFLYYFAIMYIIFFSEVTEFIIRADETFLKNNTDNLYNIITSNNLQFRVMKVTKIQKNDNGSYIISLDNGVPKEIFIDKNYEDYDMLINLINEKCE